MALPGDFGEATTQKETHCHRFELRAGQLQKPVQETRSVNREPLLKDEKESNERSKATSDPGVLDRGRG